MRCFVDIDFLKSLYCAGTLIGLHLFEPFLSLTTFADATHSKLIPAIQQLYQDLSETELENLFALDIPVFSSISNTKINHTVRIDECLITSGSPKIVRGIDHVGVTKNCERNRSRRGHQNCGDRVSVLL